MNKYTPGPWKFLVADLVKSEHGITYHEVYGANNSVVARGVISDSDACLIAAAPDLLRCLREAVGMVDDFWKPSTNSQRWFYSETRKLYLDTIAKAEGT